MRLSLNICLAFSLALISFSCQRINLPEPVPIETKLPKGVAVYGTTNDGCLLESRLFDPKQSPYITLVYPTSHLAVHATMETLLQNTTNEYGRSFEDADQAPILLGDLSRQDGGGVLLPHSSHQIGLDADIFFFDRRTNVEEWPRDYVETGQGTKNDFDLERNWWLVGYIALQHGVDRIFVAPEVKKTFCANKDSLPYWQGKQTDILKRLRPWFGHRDHFHVRMQCPRGEEICYTSADLYPIPEDDGCRSIDKEWLENEKFDHTERRMRVDYFKPGRFNARCWQEEPNEVSEPEAREKIKAFQEQSAEPPKP